MIYDPITKTPLRITRVAKVAICHPDLPEMILVETHQQFLEKSKKLENGEGQEYKVRYRVRYKHLSEKFKPSDPSPWEAALRGIAEELGTAIKNHTSDVTFSEFGSDTFPRFSVRKYGCVLLQAMSVKDRELDWLVPLVTLLDVSAPVVEVVTSPSYPGLSTKYYLHTFHVEIPCLPTQQFETKEDKQVFFIEPFQKKKLNY